MPEQKPLLMFDKPLTDWDILRVIETQECITRLQFARRLGITKSPTLIARLHRMSDEGIFAITLYTLPNGVDMYCYTLTGHGQLIKQAQNDLLADARTAPKDAK
jgi:hypothetical protein